MKKVIAACIYQVIQFDGEEEFEDYISKLKRDKQQYVIENKKQLPDRKIEIRIMKQYNKNKFIERGEKVEN